MSYFELSLPIYFTDCNEQERRDKQIRWEANVSLGKRRLAKNTRLAPDVKLE